MFMFIRISIVSVVKKRSYIFSITNTLETLDMISYQVR